SLPCSRSVPVFSSLASVLSFPFSSPISSSSLSRIRAPPTSTLFPYTTLFRSVAKDVQRVVRLQALLVKDHLDVGVDLHQERLERSEEHTSELQSRFDLVCRLLLEKKKIKATGKHVRRPVHVHENTKNHSSTGQ